MKLQKFFILLCIVSSPLFAIDLERFPSAFDSLMMRWVNEELVLQEMMDELDSLNEAISQWSDDYWLLYWRAHLAFSRGQAYYEKGQADLSITAMEKALILAEESLKLKTDSDLLSLMSQSYGLILNQKDFLYAIANWKKPVDFAQAALNINESDPKARLVMGHFLCVAPKIVGGDWDEGLNILMEEADRTDLSDLEKYYVLKSLAMVYSDRGREDLALQFCQKASRIFPQNTFCLSLVKK